MSASHWLLFITTVLCFYCVGASYMLQMVCYPTYALVGQQEFVPFHISFGLRLLPTAIVPMVLTNLATFVLLFWRPLGAPLWASVIVALCSVIILVTTMTLEVPKHNQLDQAGKSDAVIAALVRDNIPRTTCWSVASLLLAYTVVVTFTG